MSKKNPLWGAPRIHGELLKLGFEIAESTVSKYMIRRRGPPSQTWRTFLRKHADPLRQFVEVVTPTPNPYDNKHHGEMFFPCRHVMIAHDRKERAEKNDPRSCDSPLLPFSSCHAARSIFSFS
jgi:hypothetical protein